MSTIQIRNVPQDAHAVLRRRAAAAGQSLQEYLLEMLVDVASKPTVEEVLARAGSHSGGRLGLAEAAKILRRERDSR